MKKAEDDVRMPVCWVLKDIIYFCLFLKTDKAVRLLLAKRLMVIIESPNGLDHKLIVDSKENAGISMR